MLMAYSKSVYHLCHDNGTKIPTTGGHEVRVEGLVNKGETLILNADRNRFFNIDPENLHVQLKQYPANILFPASIFNITL